MKLHRLREVEAGPEEMSSEARPIGEIVRDIVSHVAEIVRSELRLVSLEVRQEAAGLKTGAISIAIGNVLLLYGGLFLLFGMVYILSTVWPTWLAFLVVGASVAIIGAITVKIGVSMLKRSRTRGA